MQKSVLAVELYCHCLPVLEPPCVHVGAGLMLLQEANRSERVTSLPQLACYSSPDQALM